MIIKYCILHEIWQGENKMGIISDLLLLGHISALIRVLGKKLPGLEGVCQIALGFVQQRDGFRRKQIFYKGSLPGHSYHPGIETVKTAGTTIPGSGRFIPSSFKSGKQVAETTPYIVAYAPDKIKIPPITLSLFASFNP